MLLLALALPALVGCSEPLSAALGRYVDRRVSDGLVFGVLLLRGELYGASLQNREKEGRARSLMELCDTILERNPRPWINPQKNRELWEGLDWLRTSRERQIGPGVPPHYLLEQNLLRGSPNPNRSTACILEALAGHRPSQTCLLQESDPRAAGYTLSHQAIYFLLSAAMNRNTYIRDVILPKLCKRINGELEYAWRKGLPPQLVDLFIEEVAVCGMSNFKDFVTEPTMEFILSLQQEEGCFSIKRLDPTADNCEEHLTAVSMVALGNYLYGTNKNNSLESNY